MNISNCTTTVDLSAPRTHENIELSDQGVDVSTKGGAYVLTHDLKVVENGRFFNKTLADLSQVERFSLLFPGGTKITVQTKQAEAGGPRTIDDIVTTNFYGATIIEDVQSPGCDPVRAYDDSDKDYSAAIDASHHDGQRVIVKQGRWSSKATLEPGHEAKQAEIRSLGNSDLRASHLIELTDLETIDPDLAQELRNLMSGQTVGKFLRDPVPADATPAELLVRVARELGNDGRNSTQLLDFARSLSDWKEFGPSEWPPVPR